MRSLPLAAETISRDASSSWFGELAASELRSDRHDDRGWERLVGRERVVAVDQLADVLGNQMRLASGATRHLGVGSRHVTDREHVVEPFDLQRGADAHEPIRAARCGELGVEVVADWADAEALEPHVGGDRPAGLGRDGEPAQLRRRGGREGAKRFAQHELDPDLRQLGAQLGAQVGTESVAEHVVVGVEQNDVRFGPDRFDLAGELDADRPRADQQHAARVSQPVVRASILVEGGVGVVDVALGRERVLRAGREHDVVGGDLVARRDDDAPRTDRHRAVVLDAPAREQIVVGQEDSWRERGIDQRAQATRRCARTHPWARPERRGRTGRAPLPR